MRLALGLPGAGIALIGMVVGAQWSEAQRGAGAGGAQTECSQATSCVPEEVFTTVGDQNCDGSVDAADVDLIVSSLYCDPCADCDGDDANEDGSVSVADVVAVVQLLTAPTRTPTVTPLRMVTVTPTATSIAVLSAIDDAAATLVGEPVSVFVLANDSDPDGDPLNVTDFTQPADGSVSFANNVATYTPVGGFTGSVSFTYTISDGTGTASATVTVVVNATPPDPATVAPPPENGVATIMVEATRFLYTGANAVQFGVAPGAIDPLRAAVVRGQVMNRDGTPLAGVRITILNHPEFGFTASRADGMFDMAVNGGGLLTVNYEKTGFCPVQRQVTVPWQDYVMVPDVVMTGLDPIVTPVTLGAPSAMQMAHGSTQSDASGTRTAMMMFMPGTSASLVLPDGTMQSVTSLNVRATEFTVGPNGPAAMPAILPPTSAYTYCVEFTADEAMSAGAMTVAFSQPVINYVENFLNFPVGIAVPTGFYDRQKAVWLPSSNGRVIKILSITGGSADVDTDGDNVADSGLGITTEERQNLATLYAAGQTLWRVSIPHFSVVDHNWSFLPTDATSPGEAGAGPEKSDDLLTCPTLSGGSIIECENQVLGDSGPIVGTPYRLNYRSDRVPDRSRVLNVRLSGPSVPASLQSIAFRVSVAGKVHEQTFPPAPNQQTKFVWDGLDAYGRPVAGGQVASGSIDYKYPVNYAASGMNPAFGLAGGAVLLENPGREEFIVSQPFTTPIGDGLADARGIGLGGWTLSGHHFYDPVSRVLVTGDGRRRPAESVSRIIDTVVPPSVNNIVDPLLATGPDGSIYFVSSCCVRSTIVRRMPDGTETFVAGGGMQVPPDFGDDGPALQASLLLFSGSGGIAIGPDGLLYINEFNVIRRVDPDGIIRRVAGKRGFALCTDAIDGGLATETQLCIVSFSFGPDGSIYTVNRHQEIPGGSFFERVRRIGPDGIISSVTGLSQGCDTLSCGDGGPAIAAGIFTSAAIRVAPDGTLYVIDGTRIRRIGNDGIIEGFAGTGGNGFAGDGGAAINAVFNQPMDFTFGADGSVLVADTFNNRIRRIGPDGIITTIAGSGPTGPDEDVGQTGDGGPALAARLNTPRHVAIGPDGSLLVVAGNVTTGFPIRRIGPSLPGISATDILIASAAAAELYLFDRTGRHLRTLDGLTGATLLEFGYDADGRLAQVTEKTGGTDNVTTILHDGAGNPTAIVGPFGQQTTLAVDANGFLASIRNPAGEQMQLTSTAGGLLTSYTDPRGKTSVYMYDADGRLIHDADPAGGTQDLARVAIADEVTVTRTTALERTTTYKTENLTGNVQRRTITAPDGTQSESTESIDAATTHFTSSDGTISDITLSADPRFGTQSPVTASFSLQFPSSLQLTAASTRSAVLANSADPLSLVSLTETATVDGRTITRTYTASSRSVVDTSPTGRTRTRTFDALGRLTQDQIAGLATSSVAYENRGRVESLSAGGGASSRSISLTHNAEGFLDTITDSIGRSAHYVYDDTGRVTSKTLPDGNIVGFGYDDAGNLTSVTPPNRPAHTFGYSDRDELTLVSPPDVPGTGPTTFAYDADGALTNINRAGVQTIAMSYDAAGRPATRALTSGGGPAMIDTFSYDAAGRLANVVAASGVNIEYTFDGPLPIGETWTGPVAGSVTRTYDSSLRLASQSINGTNTIVFSYDDDRLLTGAGSLAIVRDPQHGLPTGTTLGLVTSSLTYNGFGEVTNYTASATGSQFYSNGFGFDAIGRIAQKVETVEGITDTYGYTYDLVGQLTAVTKNGITVETYGYDANGNRTNATVGGMTVNPTYDDQDRQMQYGGTTYSYNAAGDRSSKTTGGQTTAYTYDALGNLLSVTLPDGAAVTYLIDGENRRVGKRVNGTLARGFLYGGSLRPLAELDGTATLVSRFVYAGRAVPSYLIKGGVSFRLITDQIGSVRLVVNTATGDVVQRMDYDSFGNVLLDTNPGFQPFGFAAGLYDPDTKLVRFGARDYDAETGRWTTKDPIGLASNDANLYRYCLNDAVNRFDPSGTMPTPPKVPLPKQIRQLERWLEDVTDVHEIDTERRTAPIEAEEEAVDEALDDFVDTIFKQDKRRALVEKVREKLRDLKKALAGTKDTARNIQRSSSAFVKKAGQTLKCSPLAFIGTLLDVRDALECDDAGGMFVPTVGCVLQQGLDGAGGPEPI